MKRRIVCCFALAAAFLPACTAVLGMEEAKLDNDGLGSAAAAGSSGGGSGGAGGTGGSGASGAGGAGGAGGGTIYPKPACDTPDATCKGCLAGCAGSCLNSTECRRAVNRHMNCLNTTCQDPGSCATEHFGAFPEMQDCLLNSCSDACAGVQTVASTCELYCKCMDQNCTGAIPPSTCLQDCAGIQELKDVYCRWQHCEVASPDARQHCEHAQGKLGFCPLTGARTCPNKIHSGLTCDNGLECCSGKCQGNVCID